MCLMGATFPSGTFFAEKSPKDAWYLDFVEQYDQLITEGDAAMWKRFLALLICCAFLWTPVGAVRQEKLVALTFDDGPSGRFTRRLLDGLAQRDVKATFLLCGYRIAQYPKLTQRIFQENHEIGLHGYSHRSMQAMSPKELTRELEETLALLPVGCPVVFLRPPGGLCSQCTQAVAKHLDLSILYWSVDPKDWEIHDAKAIEKDVLGKVRDGDVILMHDLSDSSVDAALAIVDALQKRGFRFVTVSELAQARNIALVPGKKYSRFHPSDSENIK